MKIERNSFEEEYFTANGNGSNYNDYRKKRYNELADVLCKHFNLQKGDRVHDFGMATGELLFRMKLKQMKVRGIDASIWAISYAKQYYRFTDEEVSNLDWCFLSEDCELLLFMDVLEHLSDWDINHVMLLLEKYPKKKILVRIPVSEINDGRYVLNVSENDRTHIQRKTKQWWTKMFNNVGYHLTETLDYKGVVWDTEGVFVGVFEWKN